MHSFLQFFFKHIEAIIMILFILGFSLAGFYIIAKAFFAKPEEDKFSGSADIEELLKKVLAQADNISVTKSKSASEEGGIAPVSSSSEESTAETGGSAEVGEDLLPELKTLQGQLEDKQTEIEKLKDDLQSKSGSGEPDPEVIAKINELEARLAEYEIIEDDIADLSKYKDENAKLKEEIEKLKSGGAVAEDASESEASKVEDEAAEKVAEEELSEEKKEEIEEKVEKVGSGETEEDVVASSEAPNKESESDPITDDLINEFEQAVNEQLGIVASEAEKESGSGLASEVGEEVEVSEASETSDEVLEEEKKDSQAFVDDLFEHAASEMKDTSEEAPKEEAAAESKEAEEKVEGKEEVKKEAPEPISMDEDLSGADDIFGEFIPEDEFSAKSVDTDKMLEEMSDLANVDTSEVDSDLDKEFDVEKMASEAKSLEDKG